VILSCAIVGFRLEIDRLWNGPPLRLLFVVINLTTLSLKSIFFFNYKNKSFLKINHYISYYLFRFREIRIPENIFVGDSKHSGRTDWNRNFFMKYNLFFYVSVEFIFKIL
jgi:hypothetical protein